MDITGGESSEWNARHDRSEWNAGGDSSQRNVIHYANNTSLTDRPCGAPWGPGWAGPSLSDRMGFGRCGRGLRGTS